MHVRSLLHPCRPLVVGALTILVFACAHVQHLKREPGFSAEAVMGQPMAQASLGAVEQVGGDALLKDLPGFREAYSASLSREIAKAWGGSPSFDSVALAGALQGADCAPTTEADTLRLADRITSNPGMGKVRYLILPRRITLRRHWGLYGLFFPIPARNVRVELEVEVLDLSTRKAVWSGNVWVDEGPWWGQDTFLKENPRRMANVFRHSLKYGAQS
jgi:hypothetical protein